MTACCDIELTIVSEMRVNLNNECLTFHNMSMESHNVERQCKKQMNCAFADFFLTRKLRSNQQFQSVKPNPKSYSGKSPL